MREVKSGRQSSELSKRNQTADLRSMFPMPHDFMLPYSSVASGSHSEPTQKVSLLNYTEQFTRLEPDFII